MKGINQNIMAFYIPIDLCIANDVSVGCFGVWYGFLRLRFTMIHIQTGQNNLNVNIKFFRKSNLLYSCADIEHML